MTFTATFPIGWSPGSPKELFTEDEPLVVEFEADVRIDWDPVDTDWPPVIDRGVSVECEPSSVDIESAMLDVECERCEGSGQMTVRIEYYEEQEKCTDCNGTGKCHLDIFPTLSAPDLARLKEECAEYAEEHALEQQANS